MTKRIVALAGDGIGPEIMESEIGDYAADDINNFLPIIGLKINGDEYRQKVMAIYPTLGDKVAGLLP